MSERFDFDVEVRVEGGVEVAYRDHPCEWLLGVVVIDDWDVTDFAIGHEVSDFCERGVWGAVDDFFGHDFGDWGCCGIELRGDDACEDVAFGDDACDFVERVGDDERTDVVFVHEVCGVEGCGGLWDGLDAFDSVCAVVAIFPVLFLCEEL